MILRCTAPRRKAPGTACGGFVARVPDGSRLVGLLAHSDLVSSDAHTVAACRACGFLHEIAPPEATALRVAA